MNLTIVILIAAAVIALVGVIMGIMGKSAWISLLFILAVIFMLIGTLLFGTESWRKISIGLLAGGFLLLVVAILVMKFRRSRAQKSRETKVE